MQLKTVPEDFIVVEVASHPVAEGPYVLCELIKRNMTTERALQTVADAINVQRKDIGYAGTKDARALTRQYVSIKAPMDRVKAYHKENPVLRAMHMIAEPLRLGMLEGNRFTIVVRGIAHERCAQLHSIPNFFDEQRFSKANAAIGHAILAGDFAGASKLVQETDPDAAERMRDYLATRTNDHLGALRLVPKHLLLMYVHSYQSKLWNEALTRRILAQDPDAAIIDGPVAIAVPSKAFDATDIPLVGFGTDLPAPFDAIYDELLERDGLTTRSFVVRSFPSLSAEGGMRPASFPVRELAIGPLEPDDIHAGFQKQTLSFVLPKGCYATMAIKCMYRTGDISGAPARG
jgi:tRNA pseudouridine13 synthase